MTSPAVVEALVERLEAATRPGRELDLLIHQALGLPEPFMQEDRTVDGAPVGFGRIVPWYTRSLDAALTLVPEGHAVSLHIDADGSIFAGVKLDDGDGCDDARPCGATPAIALCIAALRATQGG